MRESGAYFTGARLSNLAVREIGASIDNRSIILDPACGAGDLLVACFNRLARNDLVQKKEERWAVQFIGRDLQGVLCEQARLRLALSAAILDRR